MHRELGEKRQWLSEQRFLHTLKFCMLLPGPEAQQLAIYLGWLMHRTRGGWGAVCAAFAGAADCPELGLQSFWRAATGGFDLLRHQISSCSHRAAYAAPNCY